jgi:hypothetical protein
MNINLEDFLTEPIKEKLNGWEERVRQGKADMRKWNEPGDATDQLIEDWVEKEAILRTEFVNALKIFNEALSKKTMVNGKEVITIEFPTDEN